MNELEQLRTRAAHWTLADDSKLITAISSLVDSMLDRSRCFDASLLSASSSISRLHSTIDTAESAIGLYSGTQFIEQRVLEDDYRPRRPSQPVPTLSLEERQSIILGDIRLAMKNGLQMIDHSFRRLGDENDPFIQYEPIDRYNRSIPPLIGSEAFHAMGKRKKKEVPVRETISVTVDDTKREAEPFSPPLATVAPSLASSSALPPAAAAPPPPPPPMPTKPSPVAANRSALHAEITSALKGGKDKGEFRVPHDDGPNDVDTGLTPPLPPRSSLHPAHPAAVPILPPPRGSIQHATPPELPPKREEKPSTSIPLPAEPKKKSIFDFDSDDDDFAAVLSRPAKTQASSSTLSSSMRSNEESDTKSLKSQEERKESVKSQGPPSLMAELAAAAASKRSQHFSAAGDSSSAPPPVPPRSVETPVKPEPPRPSPKPLVAATSALKREEKQQEVDKPEVKKQPWVAPKKSIFDDEDSDFDELFKPAAKKSTVKREEVNEVKKEEPKKVEEKKTVVVEAPKPVAAPSKQPEKSKRKNIFDSDSDLEEFFKPKSSLTKQTSLPKKEEPPKVEKPAEKEPVTNQKREKEEERREEKREGREEQKSTEKTQITPPPRTQSPPPAVDLKPDPITADPVVKKEEEEEEKREEKREISPVEPLRLPEAATEQTKTIEEEKEEQPLPPHEDKAFTPQRESPPPFRETPSVPSKSTSEEREPSPEEENQKSTPAPVKKDSSVHFDSPPPFNQPEEEPEEEEREQRGDSSATDDLDTEAMQGNRAAFMAQLNAKLSAKPPTGMGIRPVSMIETSSTPFIPPSVDRAAVPPPITRRAASETKPEGPLSHANKSRARGPARRPPTTKKTTSSSESEDGFKSATMPRSTVSAGVSTVPRSIPPRSPVASSPVKESPVVFRKTSDPKSPPASISRKSSSSSSLDADPLSALSAVHTSPYKASSATKPPTSPMSRKSVSSTVKSEEATPSQSTDSKPKKSIFDSDSDDFYEKFGGSKTLPAKTSAFKNELESALKKAPSSSSSQKKGLFDDSDEDLDMFRKKK
ncbi:hypothetical protein PENTCL1PPCAC_28908 [Pristionchus entomophagus]|uniref:FAM21/CAPZIP domain-containing protein n=1 Tax=Pristionchus entomophagus TaxID=358040 RepID=A0AAV5UK46_9BILA|nr:hypothetical protein PENTCL1PPCAC_28908 [Pristionchus entomophagus]